MGVDITGVVLDSSVLIEAERSGQTIESLLLALRDSLGEVDISISPVTIAELVHGVARAKTPEIRTRRRTFIDELKKHVPVHPLTDEGGEVAGMLSGEQAALGINLPIDDLLIGVAAIEQGYALATRNLRHFQKIPGLTLVTP